MLFKPKSRIGLEMTDTEVRILKAKMQPGHFYIEKTAIISLQKGAVINGKIMQFDQVLAALQSAVEQVGAAGLAAAISFPAHSVIRKRLQFIEDLTDDECEAEINDNLKTYFPSIEDELAFDFIKLKQAEGIQEVLVIAARTELIESYKQAATHAHLKVKIIDIDLHALLRALLLSIFPLTHATAIVHIQGNFTYFFVLHEQQMIFQQLWHAIEDRAELALHINRQIDIIKNQFELHTLLLSTETSEELLQKDLNLKVTHVNELFKQLSPQLITCYGLTIGRHFYA